LAFREGRILLTEDKDFGQLVYAHSQQSSGIIFIRYPANARKTLPKAVVVLISEAESELTGSFIVVSPGRVRIGGRTR
jgi:predicted nuclease of predicted toxin-antitoxin system